MKLHDNSRFGGGLVILRANVNLLKTHGLVEVAGRPVGFADFQVETALGGACFSLPRGGGSGQEFLEQGPRETFPAEFGCHHQIEQLGFVEGHAARHQERGDAAVLQTDAEIVLQVIGGIPVGGLGTGGLDGRDFRQIACTAGPDCWHISYYARSDRGTLLLSGAAVLGGQAAGTVARQGNRGDSAGQPLGADRGTGSEDCDLPGDSGSHRRCRSRGAGAGQKSAGRARPGLFRLPQGESGYAAGGGRSVFGEGRVWQTRGSASHGRGKRDVGGAKKVQDGGPFPSDRRGSGIAAGVSQGSRGFGKDVGFPAVPARCGVSRPRGGVPYQGPHVPRKAGDVGAMLSSLAQPSRTAEHGRLGDGPQFPPRNFGPLSGKPVFPPLTLLRQAERSVNTSRLVAIKRFSTGSNTVFGH